MTSISGTLQSALMTAINAGSVRRIDTAPLKTAVTDIASQLTGSSTVSSASMKTRVDGLIDRETTAGKLTDGQATQLKALYADASRSQGGLGGFVSELTSSVGAGGLYGAKGSPLHAIGSLLVHALV